MILYQAGAQIVNGKLVLETPHAFKDGIASHPDGHVIVKIETPQTNRSLAQNAYLHAVPFPILANEFGCSVEDVKYDLMGEKWGWKESPLNTNHMIPVKPSTSSMTVEECREFIDWLIPWAMTEHNIAIPLPNETAA